MFVAIAEAIRALRGRNPTRNSQVKGAPKVHRASGGDSPPEAFFMPLDTLVIPQKSDRHLLHSAQLAYGRFF